jgi:hypothetical protein
MVFLFLTSHTMGQFSKLTEGFDQTKNSWVACGVALSYLSVGGTKCSINLLSNRIVIGAVTRKVVIKIK